MQERREIDKESKREYNKQKYKGRKTLLDQLNQSVQTENCSFSLSCYLTRSQSLWV